MELQPPSDYERLNRFVERHPFWTLAIVAPYVVAFRLAFVVIGDRGFWPGVGTVVLFSVTTVAFFAAVLLLGRNITRARRQR